MDDIRDRDAAASNKLPSVSSFGGVVATTAEVAEAAPQALEIPAHIAQAASQHHAGLESGVQSPAPDNSHEMTSSGTSLSPEELERLSSEIVTALKTVYDPEIPADIYELGLIYSVDIDDDRNVSIEMTLTAPGCPVAGEMPIWVQNAVNSVAGVADVKVEVVFSPPWDMSRMSDEARLAIGMY